MALPEMVETPLAQAAQAVAEPGLSTPAGHPVVLVRWAKASLVALVRPTSTSTPQEVEVEVLL